MQLAPTLIIAALAFGFFHLVDRFFTKHFRNTQQHHSGLAVRASRTYGLFGVGLTVLGILGICVGVSSLMVLILGLVVLLMGICLGVYYLSFGIFYDGETFLLSRFGKKQEVHRYEEITGQRLYLIQGGSLVIELHLKDGSAVSIQSTMDGVTLFLDTAFAGWCIQTGRDPATCDFHDPSQSLWFPTVEET